MNLLQSEETVRRKAEAVQDNLLSLDTRISICKKPIKVQLYMLVLVKNLTKNCESNCLSTHV